MNILHRFTTCSIVRLQSLYPEALIRDTPLTAHNPHRPVMFRRSPQKRHGNHHATIKTLPASAGLIAASVTRTPPETSSVEDSALRGGAVHGTSPNRTLTTDGFSLACIPSRGTEMQRFYLSHSAFLRHVAWTASPPSHPLVNQLHKGARSFRPHLAIRGARSRLNGDMVDRGIHQTRVYRSYCPPLAHPASHPPPASEGIMASGPASPISPAPLQRQSTWAYPQYCCCTHPGLPRYTSCRLLHWPPHRPASHQCCQ